MNLRRILSLAIMLSLAFQAACDSPSDPTPEAEPPEGTPRQFVYTGDPQFVVNRDSQWVFLQVTVPDSTPHRGWWPTLVHVETDRGYRQEVQLVPFACLTPSAERAQYGFPLNFDWWACDRIGINNSLVLTPEQIQEIERLTDGELLLIYLFTTMPGGQYFFRIGSVGRPAIRNALEQVAALPYVIWDPPSPFREWGYAGVFHPYAEPPCFLSDAIPPPPCPPWLLQTRVRYTFADDAAGRLPVSRGGWIRATYLEPNGRQRSTTVLID